MSEIDIWGDFRSCVSDAPNLVDRLEQAGLERDKTESPQWTSLAGPVQGLLKSMSRSYDYEAGADWDADDIAASFGGDVGSQFLAAYKRAAPLCESAIERLILPWLISQEYYGFKHNPAVLLPGEGQKYIPFTVAVIPQLPIGRYRADFALAASRTDGKVRFVIVECDGAKYHDGVGNVVKDVNRDVKLLSNDRVLDVVRIDGRHIMRDPRSAALIAAASVRAAWTRGNPDTAHKFAPAEHAGG